MGKDCLFTNDLISEPDDIELFRLVTQKGKIKNCETIFPNW